jgi:ribosomal protein S18 acetylase RimI-like enzyme
MVIRLREARPDDHSFLLEVYAATRVAELSLVPWDDAQKQAFVEMQFQAQDSYYREKFSQAEYQVILRDDEPVGRIYVLREQEEIHILDITLLPQHRHQGIGGSLIKELLDEGRQKAMPVQIFVEPGNPSLHLFERLGFSKLRDEGFNYLLEWRPSG